jgi:pentose-5-phosphate-3-epimerase/putative flippase GtrA
MTHFLDSRLQASLSLRIYRHRFLALYCLFGITSIVIEILVLRGLNHLGIPFFWAGLVGLGVGVLAAFWLNARFNFKVPLAKRRRAFLLFVAISAVSVGINFGLKWRLVDSGFTYEGARITSAGLLFLVGYSLHRKFTFTDRKKVGVAVYANGVEDIREIRGKIGDFADFIHVDLIDDTYGDTGVDVRAYRLEAVRAYWPHHEIHVHLMTRHPLRWLDDVLPHADRILVHCEMDDDLCEVIDRIRAVGKKAGVCLRAETDPEEARPWMDRADLLLLLSIERPGRSGQAMQMDRTLAKIRTINAWSARSRFSVCVDGGVNETNVHLLHVEWVVSGSSVIGAPDPPRQIMRLQTSNNHEAI